MAEGNSREPLPSADISMGRWLFKDRAMSTGAKSEPSIYSLPFLKGTTAVFAGGCNALSLAEYGKIFLYIICGPLYTNEDFSSEFDAMTRTYTLINKTMHELL